MRGVMLIICISSTEPTSKPSFVRLPNNFTYYYTGNRARALQTNGRAFLHIIRVARGVLCYRARTFIAISTLLDNTLLAMWSECRSAVQTVAGTAAALGCFGFGYAIQCKFGRKRIIHICFGTLRLPTLRLHREVPVCLFVTLNKYLPIAERKGHSPTNPTSPKASETYSNNNHQLRSRLWE